MVPPKIPYLCAAVAVVACAWNSDRTRERSRHVWVPWLLAGGLLASFGAVARRSVPGGFAVLTVSLGLAFSAQSVVFARASGLTPPAQTAITLGCALPAGGRAALGGGEMERGRVVRGGKPAVQQATRRQHPAPLLPSSRHTV